MSNVNDDERLVEFLHQYRPDVPPASPDLEQKIICAVTTSPQKSHKQRSWLVPSAVAAGLLIAWTGYRSLMPANFSTAQASLDAFLESNWDGILGGSADAQTFPVSNNSTNN